MPTVSGFISAIGATPLTNPRSSAATLAALKSHSAGPVNTLPVAHHVYDKFMKTWSKRSLKPSPTVQMTVSLDKLAYKELQLNPPDLVKKPSAGTATARTGTLDTGAQLTVANESELMALGIKRTLYFLY